MDSFNVNDLSADVRRLLVTFAVVVSPPAVSGGRCVCAVALPTKKFFLWVVVLPTKIVFSWRRVQVRHTSPPPGPYHPVVLKSANPSWGLAAKPPLFYLSLQL
jgi:hypothetical protein